MVGIDAAIEQQQKLPEFISPVAPVYMVFKVPAEGSKQTEAEPLGVIDIATNDNRLTEEYKKPSFESYEGKFDEKGKLLEKGPPLGYSAVSLTGEVFRTQGTKAYLMGSVNIDLGSGDKNGGGTILNEHGQPIGFVNYVTGGIYRTNDIQDKTDRLVGYIYPPEQNYLSMAMKDDTVVKKPSVRNLIIARRYTVGALAAFAFDLLT